jgi:hypothetical protein
MVKRSLFINQKENFAGNFGIVLRSSAVFYFENSSKLRTTVSFMNYWLHKRELQVAVIASLRNMRGKLLRREQLSFESKDVINYSPENESGDFFGSVEIEIFSNQNMVIPYPAIIAVYESARGISAVHSYARNYSAHEIEEGRTITAGEESCWTILDGMNPLFSSFCVFHNGPIAIPEQIAQLTIRRADGMALNQPISIDALEPYETVKILPREACRNLIEFLAGQEGQAHLSFNTGGCFTRMLVGTESIDGSDFQVTHSNFNYAVHETDHLENKDQLAYMFIPNAGVNGKQLVVYAPRAPGEYMVSSNVGECELADNQHLTQDVGCGLFKFRRLDGQLPSRIVTAIRFNRPNGVVPAECSLGVLTHAQPSKRLWWGITGSNSAVESRIIVHDLKELFGNPPENTSLSIRLYSSISDKPLETQVSWQPGRFDAGFKLCDLFPDAAKFLGNAFGYYSVYSGYGGFTCYSTLERDTGSMAFEHGF